MSSPLVAPTDARAAGGVDGAARRTGRSPIATFLRTPIAAQTWREYPQYIVTRYAAELLADRSDGVGYLLKDRVAHVADFVDAVRRVAAGGTALDPEVVSQLLAASRRSEVLDRLTPRECEVLALMAEGRSNAAIAATLAVTPRAVEKHVGNIFVKLDLPESGTDHRRVLAVLRYLRS